LVKAAVARQLGIARPNDIDEEAPLLGMGIDSLMAVAVRNELRDELGVILPPTVLFDGASVKTLAAALTSRMATSVLAGAQPSTDGYLASALRRAREHGRFEEGWKLVAAAADVRALDTPETGALIATRFADGPSPALVCVPALAVPTGPEQFLRLGSELSGAHAVWVLPNPGFSPGEALPPSLEAILEQQERAILACAHDAPFALVAVSSGGWIAHALASRLERRGHPPVGLVLLDTYRADTLPPRMFTALQLAWLSRYPEVPRTDEGLTAMHWYARLFSGWTPEAIATPTLFLHASDPMPEAGTPDFDWRARWDLPHTAVEVPGDHMTMVDAHAATTARAVQTWLSTLTAVASASR
jgi:thioesterase domain-containing protein/acyl carrier protein